MWRMDDPSDREVGHYRCHTGHAFSSVALQEEQGEAVEKALYSSLRILEERERLLGKLRSSAKTTSVAQTYELRLEELRAQISAVRGILHLDWPSTVKVGA